MFVGDAPSEMGQDSEGLEDPLDQHTDESELESEEDEEMDAGSDDDQPPPVRRIKDLPTPLHIRLCAASRREVAMRLATEHAFPDPLTYLEWCELIFEKQRDILKANGHKKASGMYLH